MRWLRMASMGMLLAGSGEALAQPARVVTPFGTGVANGGWYQDPAPAFDGQPLEEPTEGPTHHPLGQPAGLYSNPGRAFYIDFGPDYAKIRIDRVYVGLWEYANAPVDMDTTHFWSAGIERDFRPEQGDVLASNLNLFHFASDLRGSNSWLKIYDGPGVVPQHRYYVVRFNGGNVGGRILEYVFIQDDALGSPESPEPEPPTPPAEPPAGPETSDAFLGKKQAARFLTQATYGPTSGGIATLGAAIASQGETAALENWLADQFQRPATHHSPYLDYRDQKGWVTWGGHKLVPWWTHALTAEDELRQRVAFALHQIFVISDVSPELVEAHRGMLSYYDMLLDRSFGNFRDLLMDVTLHPAMGAYLSHFRNQKANPDHGTFPDENYAREIMQLFSIGLVELHPDGSEKTDANGNPIPTYGNEEVTHFARVFTGLSHGDTESFFAGGGSLTVPMKMYEEYHDTGEKPLLNGIVLPAHQTGMQDLNAAIDNLFHHPNVGPFLGRQLIQKLVTSNPTHAYIARVASAFNDNGSGVRGDLQAVLRAIRLDEEARHPGYLQDEEHGRQKESYLRCVALGRALNASTNDPDGWYDAGSFLDAWMGMSPHSSPSVFNFFSPRYQPPGEITQRGLVAPEFGITNDVTAITTANHLRTIAENGLDYNPWHITAPTHIEDLVALVDVPEDLVDELDLRLLAGEMSDELRAVLLTALYSLHDGVMANPAQRTALAIFLTAFSPEYIIQK